MSDEGDAFPQRVANPRSGRSRRTLCFVDSPINRTVLPLLFVITHSLLSHSESFGCKEYHDGDTIIITDSQLAAYAIAQICLQPREDP
ncbi:hypothetical protein HN011_002170 [Eciton burchellii]|nr:hypothetical protein HN011_002170 [Eciton burchellii]